jgi:hypothetical protein
MNAVEILLTIFIVAWVIFFVVVNIVDILEETGVMFNKITLRRKKADKKLRAIGFHLVKDNEYEVVYERENESYYGGTYIQVLTICYKESGRHIIQSYDKDLFDNKLIGNTCVGLTYYETKLIMQKMREKKWKSK